jgi:hypothetical protein
MVELIEGGFLAQTILVVLVWGAIAFLAVTQRPIPDALLDAGFVIIGFYFHRHDQNAGRQQFENAAGSSLKGMALGSGIQAGSRGRRSRVLSILRGALVRYPTRHPIYSFGLLGGR